MISDGALKKLRSHDYPGNVRELQNIMEQAVSMSDNEHVLTEKNLAMSTVSRRTKAPAIDFEKDVPLDEYLERIEVKIIRDALIESGGNISKAAEKLQIKRQTLQHKLKKHKLNIE